MKLKLNIDCNWNCAQFKLTTHLYTHTHTQSDYTNTNADRVAMQIEQRP